MSTPKNSSAQSVNIVQERTIEATSKIRQLLGLEDLNANDLKRLSAAVALAAEEEIAHDETFALRIQQLFSDLAPPAVVKASTKRKKSVDEVIANDDLVPIANHIDHRFDPYAPPDPKFLAQLYGIAQLPKALNRYSTSILRETIGSLLLDHPVLPKPHIKKAKKEELIAYIVEQMKGD